MSKRARIRAGDPDTYEWLFDQYARSVYNHAFRLTGNWSTAEDVMALTFLEAWRLRAKVDLEGGSLRPWLLGIATNVTRNTTRAARRHEAAVTRLPKGEVLPDFADELVARIDDVEHLAAVRRVLPALRRGEREVFALCVWSGLDYSSAAQALGIPVGTVRSRLARARKKLQTLAQAELATEKLEPQVERGQLRDGRTSAARYRQEETR